MNFFVDFVDFFFSVSSFFCPGILIHGGHSHWLTGGGTSGILLIFFGQFFLLARNPDPWWSLSLAHWWWCVGYFVGFITYGQGRWLYVVGFFFDLFEFGLLSFVFRAFHLRFRSTSLFWVLSFSEVVVGDLEACFCCCATLFLVKSVLLTPRCCFGLCCALLR